MRWRNRELIDVNFKRKTLKFALPFPPYADEIELGEQFHAEIAAIQAVIEQRPNAIDRFEFWECKDENGVYSFEIHENLIRLRGGKGQLDILEREINQIKADAFAKLKRLI